MAKIIWIRLVKMNPRFKNKNINCSSHHKLKWTPNTFPFLGKALTCSALGSEAFDDHFHFLLP